MVKLNVILKGNKFAVMDPKDRLIYSIKAGSGSKTHLLDSSGYKLYYMTADKKVKKPIFRVYLNEKEMFCARCTSMFLEPGFEIRGDNISFDVISDDRRDFRIMTNGEQIGTISTKETDKKEISYVIEISEKYFDDYIPLIAVFIDTAFSKINKG